MKFPSLVSSLLLGRSRYPARGSLETVRRILQQVLWLRSPDNLLHTTLSRLPGFTGDVCDMEECNPNLPFTTHLLQVFGTILDHLPNLTENAPNTTCFAQF